MRASQKRELSVDLIMTYRLNAAAFGSLLYRPHFEQWIWKQLIV